MGRKTEHSTLRDGVAGNKAQLEAGRSFTAKHRNEPCDMEGAEQIAQQLIAKTPRGDPATMRRAIAHFLANYAWNSAYNMEDAEQMLRDILHDATATTAWAYEAERKAS